MRRLGPFHGESGVKGVVGNSARKHLCGFVPGAIRKERGFPGGRPHFTFHIEHFTHHHCAKTSSAKANAVLAPEPLVTATARTASLGA